MKIQVLKDFSYSIDNSSIQKAKAGDKIELPKHIATTVINSKKAVSLDPEIKIENKMIPSTFFEHGKQVKEIVKPEPKEDVEKESVSKEKEVNDEVIDNPFSEETEIKEDKKSSKKNK